MKNVPSQENDDLEPEYHFDYSQAQPNRFAESMAGNARVVVLDPDVAAKFPTADAVNTALRGLIVSTSQSAT